MSDFEIERRSGNTVEAQFDTIAEADRFATWLDETGRALFGHETAHVHEYADDGLRYVTDRMPLPGSGAKRVSYWRLFRCTSCLHRVAERTDYETDTYTRIEFGATPATNTEQSACVRAGWSVR